MKNNVDLLQIPDIVTVGFARRKNSITGILSFFVYERNNVLVKKKSFYGWIDSKEEIQKIENKKKTGYKFLENIQHYSEYYKVNRDRFKMLDPRGFEFEISPTNMSLLLLNGNINNLNYSTECVLAFDSDSNIVLLPTNSLLYQNSIKEKNKINNLEKIDLKELEVGTILSSKIKNDVFYCYLGVNDLVGLNRNNFSIEVKKDKLKVMTEKAIEKFTQDINLTKEKLENEEIRFNDIVHEKQQHCFLEIKEEYEGSDCCIITIMVYKSISNFKEIIEEQSVGLNNIEKLLKLGCFNSKILYELKPTNNKYDFWLKGGDYLARISLVRFNHAGGGYIYFSDLKILKLDKKTNFYRFVHNKKTELLNNFKEEKVKKLIKIFEEEGKLLSSVNFRDEDFNEYFDIENKFSLDVKIVLK